MWFHFVFEVVFGIEYSIVVWTKQNGLKLLPIETFLIIWVIGVFSKYTEQYILGERVQGRRDFIQKDMIFPVIFVFYFCMEEESW